MVISKKPSAGSGHHPNTYPCRLVHQFPRSPSPRIPVTGGIISGVKQHPVTPVYTLHHACTGTHHKVIRDYICKVIDCQNCVQCNWRRGRHLHMHLYVHRKSGIGMEIFPHLNGKGSMYFVFKLSTLCPSLMVTEQALKSRDSNNPIVRM